VRVPDHDFALQIQLFQHTRGGVNLVLFSRDRHLPQHPALRRHIGRLQVQALPLTGWDSATLGLAVQRHVDARLQARRLDQIDLHTRF
jgi:hypothetical protein